MNLCSKCKSDGKKVGSFIVEGGERYYFCYFCSSILEKLGTNSLSYFLASRFSEDEHPEISSIDLDILKARERRSRDETKWLQVKDSNLRPMD